MFWLTISAPILGTTVGSLAILVNVLALALRAAIVLLLLLMAWTIYYRESKRGTVV